ncbi:hypothetical protein GCM10027580_20230 [Corynebacterium faecale]|uniref:hypothetical protein n=1 Tax=Corynebacterium faecale TaxID=1758466 RepID=UPI0025B5FACB|nr:hypothetical protein [Corynebacterium faecale]
MAVVPGKNSHAELVEHGVFKDLLVAGLNPDQRPELDHEQQTAPDPTYFTAGA